MAVPRHLSRFDLTGKSALVVGAAGTLGRAGALALGGAGCNLTIADLDETTINNVGSDLASVNIDANAVALWPDSEANAEKIVQAVIDVHGRLDVVFIALGTNDIAYIEN